MILAKDKGPDRERTLNDITNTGVTAALIGGARVRGLAGAQHALSPHLRPNFRLRAEHNLHRIGGDDIEEIKKASPMNLPGVVIKVFPVGILWSPLDRR